MVCLLHRTITAADLLRVVVNLSLRCHRLGLGHVSLAAIAWNLRLRRHLLGLEHHGRVAHLLPRTITAADLLRAVVVVVAL